jgi:DNA-binding MarR family transcriptional regulator
MSILAISFKKATRALARGMAMEFLYRHAGLNQREIGEMMGIDNSSVSITQKRLSE